jgi:hypothetical protein
MSGAETASGSSGRMNNELVSKVDAFQDSY